MQEKASRLSAASVIARNSCLPNYARVRSVIFHHVEALVLDFHLAGAATISATLFLAIAKT